MPRMWSLKEDKNDDHALRHGHSTHVGTDMGDPTILGTYKFGQCCPMFFNAEGATLHLEGMYRGCSCFMICGGPSLATLNLSMLQHPGILTLGVNNSAKVVRPNLWTSVDDPSRFLYSIWKDPRIMKFVPQAAFNKQMWVSTHVDGTDHWRPADELVRDMPNVVGVRRNEKFAAHRFLTENTINWGNHKDHGGCRSVMLMALRIIHLLGCRKVYLLGADFNMTETSTYAFNEGRSKGAVKNNTNTYDRMINEYMPQLKPHFDAAGFEVYNCNKESRLQVFPHKPFNEAIKEAIGLIGDPAKEKTEGMYLKPEEKVRLGTQAAAYAATQGKVAAKDD